ncbi:MAG: transporter [Mycetocola sp.]|jgi:hypothetical protein|nr:transporter [Mycetocola sp.]
MLRGWRATRSTNWLVVVSGLLEPVFYLLSMGFGLGVLFLDWRRSAGRPQIQQILADTPYESAPGPACRKDVLNLEYGKSAIPTEGCDRLSPRT